MEKDPNAKVEDLAPSWGIEVKVTLTINATKIGIESRGDPSNRLPESLLEFVAIGCNIIICATRTSGGTVDAVDDLKTAQGHEIIWFEQKDAGDSESAREAANRKMAKQIVSEVEKSLPLEINFARA